MFKYFIYSSEQLRFLKEMEAKMGKKFKVGYVVVNGTRKSFTEMVSSPDSKYSDAKIVASGEIEIMTYTLPSSK